MEIWNTNMATQYVGSTKGVLDFGNKESRNQELRKETALHRIVPISRIKEIFESEMTLVNPSFWEKNDPYENYLYNIKLKSDKSGRKPFPDRNDFFAQCWSFERNSYAMWSIYTQSEKGIMISTTPERLENCFKKEKDLTLGVVEYLSVEELRVLCNEQRSTIECKLHDKGFPKQKFETLLTKRTAYQYEQEVRLLKYEDNDSKKKLFKLSGFNTKDLVSKFTLDPRMSDIEAEVWTSYLNKLGFENIAGKSADGGTRGIERSRMLDKPKPFYI